MLKFVELYQGQKNFLIFMIFCYYEERLSFLRLIYERKMAVFGDLTGFFYCAILETEEILARFFRETIVVFLCIGKEFIR